MSITTDKTQLFHHHSATLSLHLLLSARLFYGIRDFTATYGFPNIATNTFQSWLVVWSAPRCCTVRTSDAKGQNPGLHSDWIQLVWRRINHTIVKGLNSCGIEKTFEGFRFPPFKGTSRPWSHLTLSMPLQSRIDGCWCLICGIGRLVGLLAVVVNYNVLRSLIEPIPVSRSSPGRVLSYPAFPATSPLH